MFKGYIVNDEELSGFWECGGVEGRSFTDVGNTGVSSMYLNYRAVIREPVYVEFIGRVAGEGGPGWGMAGEPWGSNIEIREVQTMYREVPIKCGSGAYSESEIRIYDTP